MTPTKFMAKASFNTFFLNDRQPVAQEICELDIFLVKKQ